MNRYLAATRYEFSMFLRRRAVWGLTAAVAVLMFLVLRGQAGYLVGEPDARLSAVRTAVQVNLLLPLVLGPLLADRLVRDDRLGVAALLDAAAGTGPARLLGTFTGSFLGAALPMAALSFGISVAHLTRYGDVAVLAWTAATLVSTTVPAMLFVTAFALTCPLVMPVPVFRVLFVGYWMWGNAMPPDQFPTLSKTVLHPLGGYVLTAFFDPDGADRWAGPVPHAVLNVMRPEPTAATASLSVGLLLTLAAVALTLAARIRSRAS
ncbi:MAG: type transport system permease protein [Actinomycetota bacterium]|nr:type transport system permease protein [Actinomycetota bacterium]